MHSCSLPMIPMVILILSVQNNAENESLPAAFVAYESLGVNPFGAFVVFQHHSSPVAKRLCLAQIEQILTLLAQFNCN